MKSLLRKTVFDKKRGLTNPLKRWSSLNYNKFEEDDIITQKKNGSIIKYATDIGLNLEDSVIEFVWAENKINFKWRNFNILIYLPDFHEHIFINNKLYNPIRTFNNEKLIKAITRNEASYFKTLNDEIFQKHNPNLKD
ncbi:hypothetical protein [Priestia megaterium]|uniref:hypothetical protein n=1 Tax=Priestia megaterium TaxID=1404 RepID=UPI00046F016E|nr:hypothetical protein [Priestia megaterium]